MMEETVTLILLPVRRVPLRLRLHRRPPGTGHHRRGHDRPLGGGHLLLRQPGAGPDLYLKSHRIFSRVLSKSRLNRRLHAIPEAVWQALFAVLAASFKATNESQEYIVDSFPVPSCDNIRIRRCKLYPKDRGDQFRGYVASKRRNFYGLRVHLLVTARGEPVEFCLAPGAENDLVPFRDFGLDLPKGAVIFADKLYTDYVYEDLLKEVGIELVSLRKENSKRVRPGWEEYYNRVVRKRVETANSRITALFPKSIHAVTPQGFELRACYELW